VKGEEAGKARKWAKVPTSTSVDEKEGRPKGRGLRTTITSLNDYDNWGKGGPKKTQDINSSNHENKPLNPRRGQISEE